MALRNENDPVAIGNLEDLCKVTTYGLSHASLSQDEDGDTWREAAVRPFGEDARRYWIEAKEEVFALIVILSKP